MLVLFRDLEKSQQKSSDPFGDFPPDISGKLESSNMFLGKKSVVFSILAMSFMFMVAIFMYTPLSRMQQDHSARRKTYRLLPENDTNNCKSMAAKVRSKSFRKINFQQLNVPFEVQDKALSVEVKSRHIKIGDVLVQYKSARMDKMEKDPLTVLLLHGRAFSSKTWEELGTIGLIAACGFHVVAVDLPTSAMSYAKSANRKDFLHHLITTLDLKKPVIVSPSMSGSFSIPYLVSYWQNISGFVPISPAGTSALKGANCGVRKEYHLDSTCYSWTQRVSEDYLPDLSCIKVPVLIVCGQQDDVQSSARLCRLPWSKGIEIPDGEHAAYMSNPELWHKLLYNFLMAIHKVHICG